MAFALPDIPRASFAVEIQRLSPRPLDERSVDALFAHYGELALWNRRTNLIGPGTAGGDLAPPSGESPPAPPPPPRRRRPRARNDARRSAREEVGLPRCRRPPGRFALPLPGC